LHLGLSARRIAHRRRETTARTAVEAPSPALVLLLVLAGAAVGTAIILIGARSSQDGREFVKKPWFLVWLVLIAAQSSLWAVSAPVFAGSWLRLRERFGIDREVWIASAAFAGAVAVLFASFASWGMSQRPI
jgi:hypothetical protein